jgi:hypothetical protein
MTVHELKTDPVIWDAIDRGEKTFEVRRNDRYFQRGDTVRLYRSAEGAGWKSAQFLDFRVGWTLMGGQYGIEPGFIVFSLETDR